MKNRKFQRKIENFTCIVCGGKVKGNGFTDHCPQCLFSKHLDENPGDRRATCGGLMEPFAAEIKSEKIIIYYQCQKCGFRHRVKAAKNDNFEAILKLASRPFILQKEKKQAD